MDTYIDENFLLSLIAIYTIANLLCTVYGIDVVNETANAGITFC